MSTALPSPSGLDGRSKRTNTDYREQSGLQRRYLGPTHFRKDFRRFVPVQGQETQNPRHCAHNFFPTHPVWQDIQGTVCQNYEPQRQLLVHDCYPNELLVVTEHPLVHLLLVSCTFCKAILAHLIATTCSTATFLNWWTRDLLVGCGAVSNVSWLREQIPFDFNTLSFCRTLN